MAKNHTISRSGRFQQALSNEVLNYAQSILFDWRLYRHDIAGSIAHATMLAKVGLIARKERDQIIRGLKQIEKEIETGKFKWKLELEDVHMNIEAALTVRVPAGAKLHTARSRNDQVATDLRLWIKDEIKNLKFKIKNLQKALVDLAERTRIPAGTQNPKSKIQNPRFLPIPGYTHLQRAQPVLAAHHLLAYVEMLERDRERFSNCAHRADVCPLGSGAIAGTSLPIDRKMTARLLGFREVSANSMDAVSDRDFVAEFIFVTALTGVHLSRLAEDLILWSSNEFGFITIGDSYTTGSSLMPQKKNPDVAELGRGKTGRLIGNLMGILTLLKGLPMTYNRDLQEDKPLLFDSAITLSTTLSVFVGMLNATRFNPEACLRAVSDANLLATEVVDLLVREGIPFRKAHHLIGVAVRYAEERHKPLSALTRVDWQRICPGLFTKPKAWKCDIRHVLRLDKVFQSRDRLIGAPGQRRVETQLKIWKRRMMEKQVRFAPAAVTTLCPSAVEWAELF